MKGNVSLCSEKQFRTIHLRRIKYFIKEYSMFGTPVSHYNIVGKLGEGGLNYHQTSLGRPVRRSPFHLPSEVLK